MQRNHTMAESRTLHVPGMSCQHCIDAVTHEVGALPGVARVVVDLDTKQVRVDGDGLDDVKLREAIDEAGFEVASIVGG